MTIAERCGATRQRLKAHHELRLAIKTAAVYRGKADEIRELTAELGTASRKASVLAASGLDVGEVTKGDQAADAVRAYMGLLGTPEGESGKEYSRVKQVLAKRSKAVSESVQRALAELTQGAPAVDETFLKKVEAIPKYADKVARIRMERQALFGGVKLPEMTPEQLLAFMKRRDALRDLLSSLNVDEFPREVLEFFAAARKDAGAPYQKLTTTVLDWLSQHGLLDRLRIKVSDTAP